MQKQADLLVNTMGIPTILLIDDKPDNLITLKALLSDFIPDCNVLTAHSGFDGMEKAKLFQPDTILLDIQMPGMDGFETCKKLKSEKTTGHIPVIFLTAAHTDSRSRIKALEIGGDAFLTKPIDRGELVAQVNAMLRIKKADDAIRESEQKYRALFENMADVYFRAELDGALIMASPSAAAVFGYESTDAMIGMNIPNTLFVDAGDWEKIAVGATETGAGAHRILSNHKDGARITLEANARVVTNAQDQPVGIEMMLRDISDREYIQELTTANEMLQREIRERKQAEQDKTQVEMQLRQAQKMEAVGTLAGGIAHDFNNILAAIIGYSELSMLDIPEGLPVRQYLQQITNSALRAKDLVKQILNFSRQTEQEKKILDLEPVIKETLNLLRATIPTTIEIKREFEKGLYRVEADPTQIHQVILNLCGNATDAMKSSGGTLTIQLKNAHVHGDRESDQIELVEGPYVKISVMDTGPGIPNEIITRVFDPFFTTKPVGSGTGMGLSVVHGIVKSHGGTISIDIGPEKGAAFHVYLPAAKADATHVPSKSNNGLMRGTESVLFVDDEPSLANFAGQMLSKLGYKAAVEVSSPEALAKFNSAPDSFDLVITDMTMPQMTGVDLAREILKVRPGIPIILCTGYSDQIDESRAKALGIRKLVIKPLSVSETSRTIREVLDA